MAVKSAMIDATLRMAGRMLCGMEIGGSTHAFAESFRETLAYLDYRLVHPFALPLPVPTPRNVRYRRAVARLTAIIDPLVDARRRANVDTGDVLSALLAARDEDGAQIQFKKLIKV
jgi:cytochrome P450